MCSSPYKLFKTVLDGWSKTYNIIWRESVYVEKMLKTTIF